MEAKSWIPIIVSAIALLLSLFSSWNTWLSPFNPQFSVGAPLLALSPCEKGENYTVTPVIPVEIVNAGARGGTIKDINVVVTAGDYRWVFVPYYFCSEFGMAAVKEEVREAFHPMVLLGRERIFKNILFNPAIREDQLRPPIFRKDAGGIPSGKYILEFYMSYGSRPELRLMQTVKFSLSKEDAEAISRGTLVFIPLDDEGVQARDALRGTLLK